MKNYYTILQLSEDANREDIQQAYRRLAKQYHPDVNKAPDAHERFCEITEAYEFLINHWPKHVEQYAGDTSYEQKYYKHQQTVIYEEFRREAQERARRQARMRYEKFRKQHEAFQESGLNDIALLFTVFFRILSVPLFLFLFLTPVVLTVVLHWSWIFSILFMWPFAIGIAWYFHDNRKNYFIPGRFYYTFSRIKQLYTEKHPAEQSCYYCPTRPANSRPYKLDLLKLKEVKFRSEGYRQHNVNYLNKSASVLIPRSQKAFIVHSLTILVKLLSIIVCLLFLHITSITWRIIFGFVSGAVLCRLFLFLTRTRSSVTYLISYGFLIRVAVWIFSIAMVSRFYTNPFDVYTNGAIHFVLVAILIFDSFLMQLISIILGKHASLPITRQYQATIEKFNEGYLVYNDVPVISFIYPLIKWIFG
jgi:hypothetical protein